MNGKRSELLAAGICGVLIFAACAAIWVGENLCSRLDWLWG
jgi:hypothetical protein